MNIKLIISKKQYYKEIINNLNIYMLNFNLLLQSKTDFQSVNLAN